MGAGSSRETSTGSASTTPTSSSCARTSTSSAQARSRSSARRGREQAGPRMLATGSSARPRGSGTSSSESSRSSTGASRPSCVSGPAVPRCTSRCLRACRFSSRRGSSQHGWPSAFRAMFRRRSPSSPSEAGCCSPSSTSSSHGRRRSRRGLTHSAGLPASSGAAPPRSTSSWPTAASIAGSRSWRQQIHPLLHDPVATARFTADETIELRRLEPALEQLCRRLDALGPPATLVHGDLHMLNVARLNGELVYFDWTDACISHPFLDLISLQWEPDETSRAVLLNAYLEGLGRRGRARAPAGSRRARGGRQAAAPRRLLPDDRRRTRGVRPGRARDGRVPAGAAGPDERARPGRELIL